MAQRVTAAIGLGSNVGDPDAVLAAAVHALGALADVRLLAVSRLYATDPVGVTDQAEFRNAVVLLDVPAGPDPQTGAIALLVALKSLERSFGRLDRGRWGPREIDLDLLTAGKGFCTLALGASIFDQQVSFTMMRGGHLTHAILGAIEVAENGDFANWRVPGEAGPGVGGAMDLAVGAANIFVAMSHVTNKGKPKLVRTCSAPLTARGCVKRIYTDLAVIDVTPSGFLLREVMPGHDPASIQAMTDAELTVAADCREMVVPEIAANGKALRRSST